MGLLKEILGVEETEKSSGESDKKKVAKVQHTFKDEMPLYEATVTFSSGRDKTFTYHGYNENGENRSYHVNVNPKVMIEGIYCPHFNINYDYEEVVEVSMFNVESVNVNEVGVDTFSAELDEEYMMENQTEKRWEMLLDHPHVQVYEKEVNDGDSE